MRSSPTAPTSCSSIRSAPNSRFIPTFFFFNDTATTEIYTLSLHDALPISRGLLGAHPDAGARLLLLAAAGWRGRSEGTRLNSSHANISYAVFCLKRKEDMRLDRFRKK